MKTSFPIMRNSSVVYLSVGYFIHNEIVDQGLSHAYANMIIESYSPV